MTEVSTSIIDDDDIEQQVSLPIIPPNRYGIIYPSLYRSGYPTLRNFRFLSRLPLVKIISMVPESPTEDLNSYCVIAKIQQIHVPILRGSLLNASLSTSMSLVIQTLLDCKSQGSVYIHCLDGRRITGLVVLLIRRMQGWAPGAAFAEYWRYQTVMRPPVSVFEMERVSKETVKFILDTIAMVRVSRREQEIPRWVNLAALLSECIVMDPLSGGIATPGSNGAIQSGNSTPNSTYPKQTQASTSGRVRATMGGAFSKRSPINIGDNDDDDEDDRIIGMQRHPQISTSNTSALSFKGSSQGNQLRRSSSLDFLLAELETDNATEKVNSIRSATLIPASNLTFKDINDSSVVGTRSTISTKSNSGKPPLPPQLERTRSIHAAIAATSALDSTMSASLEALALHGMDLKFQKK